MIGQAGTDRSAVFKIQVRDSVLIGVHDMTRMIIGLAAACLSTFAAAAEPIPFSKRFADLHTPDPVSFQQHILPMMSKVGCSGRSCHGSFQGAGGFRLSLFGYDFKADIDAMNAGDEPRINKEKPEDSLILKKPAGIEKHKGKKLFETGSWQYNVLLKWLRSGAKDDSEGHARLTNLELFPREIVFKKAGQSVQIRVLAHWDDGSIEDVTDIARFRTNDESVAKVDEKTGLITSEGKGDTHIVAFYDNGVAPLPVMLPIGDKSGPDYPKVATRTKIDELVVNKLRKLGVVPSEICTDEEFLRRVSLDMTGTLPTAPEIAAFLADPSTDKRSKKIDELLTRPTYAAWWTTRLCDITGNNTQQISANEFRADFSRQWYDWIYKRVADNTPYDKMIEGIVMAVGRMPNQTYAEYSREMSGYVRKHDPANFADRPYMPYYWMRNNVRKPQEKALSFTYAFLGVRLQCAECHKHPFDQWTQSDFQSFQAFFNGVEYTGRNVNTRDPEVQKLLNALDIDLAELRKMGGNKAGQTLARLARDGKVIPFEDVKATVKPGKTYAKLEKKEKGKTGSARVVTPKVLGGSEVTLTGEIDPRQPLMDWLRDKDNPYFAKAWVNRVWANYFGAGIIEPADDLNLANPPSNAALLDHLASQFIARDFDMKWLHREIANSDAYQRSWKPNETNKLDRRNFSHSLLRRLPAEVAYDAINQATGGDDLAARMMTDMNSRAIGPMSSMPVTRGNGNGAAYALNIFGKPERLSNCDCERSAAPTILQSVYLSNDSEAQQKISEGWIRQLEGGNPKSFLQSGYKTREKDAARVKEEKSRMMQQAKANARIKPEMNTQEQQKLVEEMFLRALSRRPTVAESDQALQHLGEAPSIGQGMRDLLWVVVNTKEFLINH